MPLYYEVAKNYNSIESGIAIFPFTFTTAPAAIVVGFIITKTGKYRPSIVCFLIITLFQDFDFDGLLTFGTA
jgi:hypothetical protein